MAILQRNQTFTPTDQVTSTKLHDLVDLATFHNDAVDGLTIEIASNKLAVKNVGITTAKIADDAVTPAKLDDDNESEFVMAKVAATAHRSVAHVDSHSSGDLTIDLDDGNFQIITLNGNVGTVQAVANQASGKHFTILIKPDGGDYSITSWDSTWKWFGGTAPTITGTDGSVDIISGVSDGTNVYVSMLKNFA